MSTAHLNSDTVFSLEIFYLYLDFFFNGKLELYTQIVPNILKIFPITEVCTSLSLPVDICFHIDKSGSSFLEFI